MAQNKLHVKKGDMVVVISGKDKGKKGKVLQAFPKEGKVIVEGVNIVTKHRKATSPQKPGGIIHQEAPIYSSKVMLYCENCGRGVRYGVKVLEMAKKYVTARGAMKRYNYKRKEAHYVKAERKIRKRSCASAHGTFWL